MQMINTDINKLNNDSLDWAIATVQNQSIKFDPMGFGSSSEGGYWIWNSDKKAYRKIGREFSPSTIWEQGGLILEHNNIAVSPTKHGTWLADSPKYHTEGDTPLIAAMKCYLMNALDNITVEIPTLLINN